LRLIDTNVIVYTIGAAHPLKEAAERVLSDVAAGELAANVDTETLQEILHVYSSRGQRNKGFRAVEHLLMLFPNPFTIGREEIERARDLMMEHSFLVTRDAIHAAVVRTHGLEGIVTADKIFDRVKGVKRFDLK
jgi:predicted nucleic acid-binding protein